MCFRLMRVFKSVISTDTDYEQAQAHIKELKPKIVEAFIEKANKEHESEKYSESLKTINTAINLIVKMLSFKN